MTFWLTRVNKKLDGKNINDRDEADIIYETIVILKKENGGVKMKSKTSNL